MLEELFDRVYANFIEEVDAVDNGISAFDGTPRWVGGEVGGGGGWYLYNTSVNIVYM